ncbi:hypothetical protein C2G38_2140885 [Gigaspora rosea]|uniref:Uncharacterized protein n=1 Tax=Gigaspora rosea TaxID=44941 RepID=A0A397VGR1_9GLOM|nr:hypothetical protein C2G38_2140885 [Gigaspora rosea]
MTINSVDCDTSVIFGITDIVCIVSVNINNTTRYISIQLTQSELSSIPSEIYNLLNVTGLSHQGWRAKTMPFGSYILGLTAYDDNDHNTYHYIYAYDDNHNTQVPLKPPSPFLTNYFGANVIMDNNTLLLASQYTTNNASWSLLTIKLPSAYGLLDDGYDNTLIETTFPPINANVSSSTTTLNITLYINVICQLVTSPSTKSLITVLDKEFQQQ